MAMWIRSVRRSQERFLAELDHGDPYDAAVAAGLAISDPGDARLLASLRREDLVAQASGRRSCCRAAMQFTAPRTLNAPQG
jgi:hypothetical protein